MQGKARQENLEKKNKNLTWKQEYFVLATKNVVYGKIFVQKKKHKHHLKSKILVLKQKIVLATQRNIAGWPNQMHDNSKIARGQ